MNILYNRAQQIITQTISSLNFNLERRIVLTEVGSGNYLFTPLIPLLAGAEKVYAVTKNSKYGLAKEIISDCKRVLQLFQIDLCRVEFVEGEYAHLLRDVDIITNSGFLRPLSKNKLKLIDSRKTVIPLMYEAWEARMEDIDIEYCKNAGIRVAGTWENNPKIKVFDYVGVLCIKLILNAGNEIVDNVILIYSDDDFGIQAKVALEKFGARQVIVTSDIDEVNSLLETADGLLICKYREDRSIIGEKGIINLSRIAGTCKLNITHLYGSVDLEYAEQLGFNVFPRKTGYPQVMSETLGYVGLLPILRLQTAGFKVAAEMLSQHYTSISQPIVK